MHSIVRRSAAIALCVQFTCAATAAPDPQGLRDRLATLVTEHLTIASDTPGISLYVRNKRPRTLTAAPERTVLFVHGATYPAETSFDLALDAMSWMDYIAAQGWDVYLVDIRGYGRSTRPAEMEEPAADNRPIVATDVAVRDVASAVDFILKRRAVARISLIGWSWGTSIMATYAAQHGDKVNRLVLYAPLWLRDTPSLIATGDALGAYRQVTKDAAKKRWLNGVPPEKAADLIPAGWFEAWADATWATDPKSRDSGLLRAPNGVIHDVREYWSSGRPLYDPAEIRVPTLLIKAEWDQDTPAYMAQAIFGLLRNARLKRYVEIGEGTHTVIMERNRMQLFREVQLFLEE